MISWQGLMLFSMLSLRAFMALTAGHMNINLVLLQTNAYRLPVYRRDVAIRWKTFAITMAGAVQASLTPKFILIMALFVVSSVICRKA